MRGRAVVVNDAARLAEIHLRAWQAAYAGLLPQTFLDGLDLAERVTRWETILAADTPGQATLAAEDAGRLLGFVHVCPARDIRERSAGEISTMYVAPEWWRQGVGRRLMVAAVDQFVGAGFSEAVLWVLSGNERAIAFYRASGWAADGATKRVTLGGRPWTEIRMTRRLQ